MDHLNNYAKLIQALKISKMRIRLKKEVKIDFENLAVWVLKAIVSNCWRVHNTKIYEVL